MLACQRQGLRNMGFMPAKGRRRRPELFRDISQRLPDEDRFSFASSYCFPFPISTRVASRTLASCASACSGFP